MTGKEKRRGKKQLSFEDWTEQTEKEAAVPGLPGNIVKRRGPGFTLENLAGPLKRVMGLFVTAPEPSADDPAVLVQGRLWVE